MITVDKFKTKDDPIRVLRLTVYHGKTVFPKLKLEVERRGKRFAVSQIDGGGVKTLIVVDDKELACNIAKAFAEFAHDRH